MDQSSLEEDQSSPGEEQSSPEEDQSSPGEEQSSPEEDQSSPEEDQSSPEEDLSSPKEDQSSPGEDQSSPRTIPAPWKLRQDLQQKQNFKNYCTIIYLKSFLHSDYGPNMKYVSTVNPEGWCGSPPRKMDPGSWRPR